MTSNMKSAFEIKFICQDHSNQLSCPMNKGMLMSFSCRSDSSIHHLACKNKTTQQNTI